MLDVHARGFIQWDQLIESVPAHCRQKIVDLALEYAESWKSFAQRLEQREGSHS
jgi:hypothetical protein